MNKKDQILAALSAFISQRSGMDYANYGDRDAFMGDYRPMLRAGRDARQLLRQVQLRDSISESDVREGFRAYSGRLSIVEKGDGVACHYCAGQYFPTEYRNAACAVLASILWTYARTQCNCADGNAIRKWAKREFGRGIAVRWFA